ncbi:formate dehydrogenase accessory sulfurtransferase FdhD [Paenibacillus sp. PAMC21692]|uniref:formate dehydrogenase accessory sulfurtransferase FdhD n=1 Tax=Paenibacillus sp. PAMC21692 TaxID=2762320 RepID=UPI00164D975C|nr:formate dehydrogenase accessory sulfurtransferase FdhD [Paenibacillus sp. PAMC21692]QNK57132.1 formate dehydrogenase accessory sulfurtransferase FdhD [Paenibacillus sp. PAMC21692]
MDDGGRGNVTKWQTLHVGEDGIPRELEDEIASEYALTVVLNGDEFGTLVCSPTHQEELVYGFLASEGAIRSASQVKKLTIDGDRGYAYVVLDGEPSIGRERSSKRFIGSCCGKGRQFYYHGDMLTARTIMTRMTVTDEQVWSLMAALQESSADFISTGGVHNAALCTPEELLAVRTDIGRHNALDKLYGYSMLHGARMGDKLIAFSGRLSSEVVLKAAKMGCGLLLSKSAPTDLALKLADELGITCIGFIRGRRFSVYTHRERLIISHGLP